jgi:hypothetical protein
MDIEVRSLVNKMKDILREEESDIAQKQELKQILRKMMWKII